MERIVTKASFSVIGVELKTTSCDGKNFIEIPRFWEKVMAQGTILAIPGKTYPDTMLGMCMDFEADGGFSYVIGAEVTGTGGAPEGMVFRTIPGARYAVFTARGRIPGSVQETTRYIYRDWLPTSGFQRGDSAEFELYDGRCRNGDEAEVDVYVPIVPRGQGPDAGM